MGDDQSTEERPNVKQTFAAKNQGPRRSWREVAAEDHAQIQTRASEAAERFAARRAEQSPAPTEPESLEEVSLGDAEAGWRGFTLTDEAVKARDAERRSKMEAKSAKRKERAEKAKRDWAKRSAHSSKTDSGERQPKTKRAKSSQRSKSSHRAKPASTQQSHRKSVEGSGPADYAALSPTIRDERQPYKAQAESPSSHHTDVQEPTQNASDEGQNRKNRRRTKRARPPIDGAWVKRSGMHYLGRFSASEAHFRSVLMSKIKRAESRVSEDPQDHEAWIEAAVEEGRLFGALNDEQLALGLARSLRRRGLARGAARQKLRQKKLESSHIDQALTEVYTPKEGEVDPTLNAAARAAKKKRLGPWGPANIDYPTRQKQLAKLARRGFSYTIANRVLSASLEEAEVWLYADF